jgi:hypothetical protein
MPDYDALAAVQGFPQGAQAQARAQAAQAGGQQQQEVSLFHRSPPGATLRQWSDVT